MSPITTHVLDLAEGQPARGVTVSLAIRSDDGTWNDLANSRTDTDGRVRDLLPEGATIIAGAYRLRFDTLAYYQALGLRSFHAEVVITFLVEDPSSHYHVPLLLSPFGYSTYRGS